MRNSILLVTISLCIGILFSCANDNLESLSPKKNSTTTTSTIVVPDSSKTTVPAATPANASTVSFSKDIKPILGKYQCASCHGSSYAAYSGAGSLAKSGQLYGTMSWSNGYRKMPPSQKATASELALISTWIKEGTLNN